MIGGDGDSAWKKDKIMSKKLLIDARQSDETRIILLNNNTLEDFDYESSHRKQLKGNIYLARVTRVEASLQAAFVEYGGNRQGFLPFSEIHPDYYRIPIEDREKLLAEEDAQNTEETDSGDDAKNDDDDDDQDNNRERRRQQSISRHYKIQEVISNRQILLIQVVKEERGSKGAAVTTYVSLAGRYCVLMPNTSQGGGVSRKINAPADRKKLKTIVSSLDVAKGMAVIVRTAGSKRTKAEITRDFNYLTRQWDDIRSLTMESTAPALIHEEGNLLKRSIRDHYSTDVDEIWVEGVAAFEAAKQYMKNLMPTHVKKVKAYDNDKQPLFQHYQVETMLAAMHEPRVELKSGGSLVINQTEALVAIDVNSGRATRERNIEETALKTNLEAAVEIAQQLRQRDLSGLIVIDFIDMESKRNQATVERKLKDSIHKDRARIQIGSISQFGLLEMSRQRLRPSLAESVTNACPHCDGTGLVRSVESAALQVLRTIETQATKAKDLKVYMNANIALYILNHKRAMLASLEQRLGIRINLEEDNTLIAPEIRIGETDSETQPHHKREGRRNGKSQQNSSKSPPRHQEDEDDDKPPRRRRGRRGGRRHNNRPEATEDNSQNQQTSDAEAMDDVKAVAKKAKKAAKKGAKTETKAKKSASAKAADSKTADAKVKKKASKSAAKDSRQATSSAPVNVVDVSDVKPSAKKKGYWS